MIIRGSIEKRMSVHPEEIEKIPHVYLPDFLPAVSLYPFKTQDHPTHDGILLDEGDLQQNVHILCNW